MRPAPIWQPDPAVVADSAIGRFAAQAGRTEGRDLTDYRNLWAWSVEHPDRFWAALWNFYHVRADGEPTTVLADADMPGARWFPGTRLNYAEHALRHAGDPDVAHRVAVISINEDGVAVTLTWAQLRARVASVAGWLRGVGVRPGDRVVGYLPNCAPAVIAFLATAAVGAVWSACAQDYGAAGAAARFAQLEPVVLFAADGYCWNGREHDRRTEVAQLRHALPSLRAVVHVPHLNTPTPDGQASKEQHRDDRLSAQETTWSRVLNTLPDPRIERVEFDAPLWVLFSSGTTGVPKGIVHGHGGVLLEHLKLLGLHLDVRPGRPLFWYSSPNWVVWNLVVSGLLVGAPIVLYDGSPTYPGPDRLWRIAAEHHVATLGVSPGYLAASEGAGLRPGREHDLSALRVLGSTGAPLPAHAYHWVHDHLGAGIQVSSTSGGTDIAGAFASSAPNTPVWPGEISAPCLGVNLAAWDEHGQPVTDEVGELVVTAPMPSMPLYFWNDPDGQRLHQAYFDTYPGVWRHGDWMTLTAHGSVIISGRSDSTLNRNGVRLGSSEVYQAIDGTPGIVDSLVIGAELPDGGYWLVLFVVPADGCELDHHRKAGLNAAIAAHASPRHVPDDIIAVPALPHTRTGKKLEVPVKRLIQGQPLAKVADPEAIDDYQALLYLARYAQPTVSAAVQSSRQT